MSSIQYEITFLSNVQCTTDEDLHEIVGCDGKLMLERVLIGIELLERVLIVTDLLFIDGFDVVGAELMSFLCSVLLRFLWCYCMS